VRVTQIDTVQLDDFPSLLFVRVHTDEGLIGLGETFFHANAAAEHVHSAVAPYLLGLDARQIERHARALRSYVGNASSGAELRAASAIDVALWDVCGQALGEPIHQLLGGASRDEVRTYNTCAGYRYVRATSNQAVGNWGLPDGPGDEGPYEDLDAFLRRADELALDLLAEGVTAMKIWPFDPYAEASGGHDISVADLDRALEPFRKIRDAVGARIDIMVELHALWDVAAACRIVKALEPFDPYWIEDPVNVANAGALAEVQARTHVPIAAGETLAGLPAFRSLLEREGARVAIVDIGWVGGLTTARKVAALAEAYERPIAPHDCTGPINYTAAAHLSLHVPNAIVQEHVRAFATGWYRELVTCLPVIERGMLRPPSGPGLGTALRPEVLEREGITVRTSRNRH
jgi:L-alanine-DL-glutamate epimerase-like enolase superfamily enzyme